MRDDTDLQKRLLESHAENQRLTALVETLQQQLQQSLDSNKKLEVLLADLQGKLDILIVQTKKRNKRDYGKKTEKHNPRPALDQKMDHSSAAPAPEKSIGIKHILKNAANVSREPLHHPVKPEDSVCPDCRVATVFVGNTLTHQLEMLSASLKVIDHLQETRSCPKCKTYIVKGEKPCQPIPGSYAGPRLLGEIIVAKVEDGLPNNRQQKRFARSNVTIPRSTQSDWMQATALSLSLLYELQKRDLLQSRIIKTDDTSIKIQDRKLRNNIRKGKITAYIGDPDHKSTVFDFSEDLSFGRNLEFLKDFKGIVQADAAGGFDALFRDGSKIEAGCHAHSRRKYFEAEFSEANLRNSVLNTYRELYEIERQVKDKSPPERLAIRRRKSKPLIRRLRRTILRAQARLTPSHELMKGINYTLKHWIALTRFLKDPEIGIDNNAAERAIKCWVLVRKNSLFAGSDNGARAIALHLSFVATCKRNGVNPVDWYADVLSRINEMKTSELHQLLPQNWTPPPPKFT